MAKRLIEFLRSVLPADPYQLLLLGGVVCLSTVHGLKWWPAFAHVPHDRVASSFGRFVLNAGVPFLLPAMFAVAAGYFVCFWPGRRPMWRILTFVVFPIAVTIILTLGRFAYLAGPTSSILQGTGVTAASKLKWIQTVGLDPSVCKSR